MQEYEMREEMAWQNMRAEAHELMKNKKESLIKKWLDDIRYKEPIGYYQDFSNKTMEIYATQVGCLIGKSGINIQSLKNMLAEKFGGEWKINFVEIRGGFVGI